MSDINSKNTEKDTNKQMHLDDASRVRVLSPGMMVAKRFFRNRLAIVGMVIIIAMFLFAFLGGVICPYSQSQVFYTTDKMQKDYAGVTAIDEFQFQTADGQALPKDIASKMVLVNGGGDSVFTSRDGSTIGAEKLGDNTYLIYSLEAAKGFFARNENYLAAVDAGKSTFEANNKLYFFDDSTGKAVFYTATELGAACQVSFTAYSSDVTLSYEFYRSVLIAMNDGETSFEADGTSYTLKASEESALVYNGDIEYAFISNMNFNAAVNGIFLSPAYKMAAIEAINAGETSFSYAEDGESEVEYTIKNKNGQVTIKSEAETSVIDKYASPSRKHWFGTDGNGMDLLARLMYGGRISLLIGFVVIFIEVFVGMIIGGVAGFFGGWVDNLLMRVVDIVYCIPAMPLYLILGSIMDYYQASSTIRIYMLCIIMGVIGWVGIARIVRGQILSLREQEFMVAAEATGISTRRRIFRHLVPNVIPQLIVFASMGLGDVILAEATLSFLGLGIKYPAASWGSIINAVTDSYVMTNYLFVWLPAGIFILLTVLAFNFIGDGLRDAFDPKMKR